MTKDENIWLVSDGLQVNFDDPTEEYIKVCFGELEGTFQSMDSKNNRLTFQTSDIELALSYIKKSPNDATIVFSNFVYKFNWKNHNYSVKKVSKYALLVTIEEKDEQ